MFGNVREWTGEVGDGAGEVSEGTGEVGEETGEVGEDTGNVKDKYHTPAYRSIDLTSHRTYLWVWTTKFDMATGPFLRIDNPHEA